MCRWFKGMRKSRHSLRIVPTSRSRRLRRLKRSPQDDDAQRLQGAVKFRRVDAVPVVEIAALFLFSEIWSVVLRKNSMDDIDPSFE